MAIDTENKRRSVANWLRFILPVPDGSISKFDREHAAGFYCGIPAGMPVSTKVLDLTLSNLEGLNLTLSNAGGG